MSNTKKIQQNAKADELLSFIAHQLRTPLAVIRLDIDLLQQEIGPLLREKHVDILAEMQQATTRLHKYIGDVLHVGYMETGRMKRTPKALRMSDCIEEVIGLYQTLVAEKDINIERNFPPAEQSFTEDPHLVRVVLDTIISNAIRYSPRHATVYLEIQENTDAVTVRIKDEGPGIAVEEQVKIFEKHYRGEKIAREHPNGSGLGLYLARRVMDDFIKGSITVESPALGYGTTFVCHFPRNV